MLRILRKIKPGKPAGENSGSFWTFAIAESVLIFLGILLALQVDNWNQERQDRKLERILLSEMLGNLHADLEDLNQNIQIMSDRIRCNQVVLDFLESESPWHDSLGYHFGCLMGGSSFLKNSSAYRNMESIGLNLVRNDSLRSEITALYTYHYNYQIKVEELGLYFRQNQFLPIYAKELDMPEPWHCVPRDVKRLRQNNEFKLYMGMNLQSLEFESYTSNLTKTRALDLIKHLESELNIL